MICQQSSADRKHKCASVHDISARRPSYAQCTHAAPLSASAKVCIDPHRLPEGGFMLRYKVGDGAGGVCMGSFPVLGFVYDGVRLHVLRDVPGRAAQVALGCSILTIGGRIIRPCSHYRDADYIAGYAEVGE